MSEPGVIVREPWTSPRREAAGLEFAMWLFLVTEVLFFGALFCFYAVNRWAHPEAVAKAGHEAAFWYGFTNTLIITISGLCMAIADRAVKERLTLIAGFFLWATLLLGLAFLAVKGAEYHKDLGDHLWPRADFKLKDLPGARPFWAFYWTATFIHAIHMTIGLGIVARLIVFYHRGLLGSRVPSMTVSTLYWEFVDIIWLFLFPMIYLVGRP